MHQTPVPTTTPAKWQRTSAFIDLALGRKTAQPNALPAIVWLGFVVIVLFVSMVVVVVVASIVAVVSTLYVMRVLNRLRRSLPENVQGRGVDPAVALRHSRHGW